MSKNGQVSQPPILKPVGRRPSLPHYLRLLWGRRHYIGADSRTRAYSGNRDMLLGNLWLIGQPILQGLIYYIIFGLILKTSRGIENFPAFLITGIFLFGYTASCATSGVGSMASARTMIRAFNFPRAAVPLSVLLREAWSMLPILATLALLLHLIPPGTTVTSTWIYFPLVFLLQTLFNMGVTLYAARFGHAVPDLRHLLTFVVRLWFYGSGVLFAIDRFVTDPTWLMLMKANPLYLVLDMSRDLLIYDTIPEPHYWLVLTVWALVTPVLGFLYFWQGEETYDQE